MNHITQLCQRSVATHENADFLNDVGSVGTIYMTAQQTVVVC